MLTFIRCSPIPVLRSHVRRCLGMTSFALTNRSESGHAWLFIKVSAFTLIVPGSTVVLAPYLLLPDASVGAIDVYGLAALHNRSYSGLFGVRIRSLLMSGRASA